MLLLGCVPLAYAQGFPDHPVRLVVASAAGGALDTTARYLADRLAVRLGQPVVVENKPGAGSMLAGQFVAKSPADGYTLLMVSSGYSTLPALYPKMPFAMSELAPVAVITSVPYIFVAHPDTPYNTIEQFIAQANARPGTLNFGSGGNATGGHLLGVWFKSATGIEIEHIPYKGEAPAMQAVLANQISIMPVTISLGAPLIKAGKLKALAISSGQRSTVVPDVPTLTERGIPVQSVVWFGMLAPAGVPPAVMSRLNAEVNAALSETDLRNKYLSSGMTVDGGSSADFQKLIDRESAQWDSLIRKAGIKAD